jgi:hypothetical protein
MSPRQATSAFRDGCLDYSTLLELGSQSLGARHKLWRLRDRRGPPDRTRAKADGESSTAEDNTALPDFSDEEWADMAWKLNSMRHEYSVPRTLRAVLAHVFYVAETAI